MALVATFTAMLAARGAPAYELRLVPATPTVVQVGDLFSFDVYLDTQGESNILAFSVGATFDPTIAAYYRDWSWANDYYPLYTPSTPEGLPPTWLYPAQNPPALWPVAPFDQVNLEFEVGTRDTPTRRTDSNLWMGRLYFEAVAPGTFLLDWGFGKPGTLFEVGAGGGCCSLDIADEVSTPGSTFVTVVPEPGMFLLVGLGLAATAYGRRPRR